MKFQVELLRSFPQRFLLQPYRLQEISLLIEYVLVKVLMSRYCFYLCDINEARSTAATSSLATTVIDVFARR